MDALDELIRDRNEALFSFDEQKIMDYMVKYHLVIPHRKEVFWGAVCKAILGITDAPESARKRAMATLDVLGMDYTF